MNDEIEQARYVATRTLENHEVGPVAGQSHVKDLLALLRFAQNPRDAVAGFRIMLPVLGADPTTARRVFERMADQPSPIRALGDIPAPARLGESWSRS